VCKINSEIYLKKYLKMLFIYHASISIAEISDEWLTIGGRNGIIYTKLEGRAASRTANKLKVTHFPYFFSFRRVLPSFHFLRCPVILGKIMTDSF